MKRYMTFILSGGLVLAIVLSNFVSFIKDGRRYDKLRGSVLRLHILANSDSEEDQRLKLCVRDALLEKSSELFGDSDSLEEAEAAAQAAIPEIIKTAEDMLRSQGCTSKVKAELRDMHFDERTYGDITMPAGDYRALRVTIGEAEGHNWWCVMYPPLCIPSACAVRSEREEEYFEDEELEIMYKPKKYRIRFAVWDRIKSLFD